MPSTRYTDMDCCQAFAASYETSRLPAMRAVEREVLGCDFGGTSWTTSAQAMQIVGALGLRPGIQLLDIGAGSGWPGLFLAGNGGCDVTLLDLPANALAIAEERAKGDGMADRVATVSASAAAMPIDDNMFDVISHSDLLCCLPEKLEVLQECKRVAKDDARMHFSVIYVSGDSSEPDHKAALEVGPPFIESDVSYPDLLEQSGWRMLERIDVTSAYRRCLGILADAFANNAGLIEALGAEVARESREHRLQQIAAIDSGFLVRETFLADIS